MTIQDFNLAWVVVKDLNKAIEFYTQVIGMKLEEHNEQFGWAELAGQNGGSRLGLPFSERVL